MIYSGIFNSVNGDRKYNAWWFAKYFSTFIGNGVFPNPSTNLQVVEGTNMQVIVKPGSGWIDGYFLYSDGDHALSFDVADGVLKRIDRIVMRLDFLERKIDIVVKKGAYATSPVAPILQRDTDYHELALADVFIANGATQITQANITDTRLNKTLCGIVSGTVNQVDTTTLFNQYQSWYEQFTGQKISEMDAWQAQEKADFDEWFESIKDILNENVAGNLQSQIDTLAQSLNQHVDDNACHVHYAVDTGSANTKVVSLSTNPKSYIEGMGIAFKNRVLNTGPCVINVNGLGNKPLVKSNGSPLFGGSLKANSIYTVRYNGVSFILQVEGGGLDSLAELPNSEMLNGVLEEKIVENDLVVGSYVKNEVIGSTAITDSNYNFFACTPTNEYLAKSVSTTSRFNVYRKIGVNYNKLADPTALFSSTVGGMSMGQNPFGIFLAVSSTSINVPFYIYRVSGNSVVKMADLDVPMTRVTALVFSSDGMHLYAINASTFSKYSYDEASAVFKRVSSVSVDNSATSILISNSGKYVMVLNRGQILFVVYTPSMKAILNAFFGDITRVVTANDGSDEFYAHERKVVGGKTGLYEQFFYRYYFSGESVFRQIISPTTIDSSVFYQDYSILDMQEVIKVDDKTCIIARLGNNAGISTIQDCLLKIYKIDGINKWAVTRYSGKTNVLRFFHTNAITGETLMVSNASTVLTFETRKGALSIKKAQSAIALDRTEDLFGIAMEPGNIGETKKMVKVWGAL